MTTSRGSHRSLIHRALWIGATAALVVAGAMAAEATHGGAHPRGMMPGHPPGPPPLAEIVRHHAAELGIDDATLEQIDSIVTDARTRMQPLESALREAHETLRSLMDADEADESAIVAQVQKVGAAETALHVEGIKTDLAVRKLLTADQLATLRDLRPPRPEGMGGGPGGGCMGGPHDGGGDASSRSASPRDGGAPRERGGGGSGSELRRQGGND